MEETPELMLSGERGPGTKPGREILPGAEGWTPSSRSVRATVLLSKPLWLGLLQQSEPTGTGPQGVHQPSPGATCSTGHVPQTQNPVGWGTYSEMLRAEGHPACSFPGFPYGGLAYVSFLAGDHSPLHGGMAH